MIDVYILSEDKVILHSLSYGQRVEDLTLYALTLSVILLILLLFQLYLLQALLLL